MFKRNTQTVAGILAGFQKTVDQLLALNAAKTAEANALYDQAQRVRQEAALASEEAQKATAAAARLQAVIG